MINNNELMISNKSYINKDFASIYPELLDYVKILTNKWNPQTSNESDPGVVLLKLLGFMGDKLDYNIDKNALENFVLSCTQESSMRKNLAPLGYSMRYYQSAETYVQFTYIGDKLDSNSTGKSFTIDRFSKITTDDGSIQFITKKPVTISAKNVPYGCLAIQGEINTLKVGDSDIIQLENIDANNRLYFPTSMVAENGVFVANVDNPEDFWEKEDNLNVLTPHQKAFLFGFDSARGLPYIEFPGDISDLIKNGLKIQYITTRGLDGNISAKMLTKLVSVDSLPISGTSDETISFKDEDESSLLLIKNESASINGANPETINDAYNNFKKTIGTFDTLVACRDYANYIYNMVNTATDSYVVSNVQVSDRRDDITYSTSVVSYGEYGQYKVNVKNTVNEDVNAFHLFLYPLKPITSYTVEGYNESFEPLLSTTYITRDLELSKCLSHDYYSSSKPNYDSDVYAFKNMLKLNAKIATTYKVNAYERKDIIANVISALIKKFNARNVDYGYEIPYDEILKTMESADQRISYVNLLEPELKTRVMARELIPDLEGNEVDLISSSGLDYILSLLAHNVLSGKVSLFDYDDDFNYDFGQKQIQGKQMKLTKLKSISTETKIELQSGKEGSLHNNEVIQMLAPSLISEISYTAYTGYHYKGNEIKNGTNYRLGEGEELWIYYTDSATKEVVVKKYGVNDIIQPKGFGLFGLKPTQEGSGVSRTFIYNGVEQTLNFIMTAASQSIEIRRLNATMFAKPTNFYWIRNNSTNSLFTDADAIKKIKDGKKVVTGYSTILGDGEYLFYTDEGFNNLVSLGSGTTIETNITNLDPNVFNALFSAQLVTYEEIESEGLLSLKEKWKYINLTKDAIGEQGQGTYIKAQENTILTLTKGDKITWTKEPDSEVGTLTLGNRLQPISGTIKYQISGETSPHDLEQYNLGDDDTKWKIKSRLDIDSGKDYSQSIEDNRQTITFTPESESDAPITLNKVGQRFNLNENYQFLGSDYIDVTSKDIITNDTLYPFSVYCYELQTIDDKVVKPLDRDSDGYASVSIKNGQTFDYDVPIISNEHKLLMVYATLGKGVSELTLASTDGGIKRYNFEGSEFGPSLELTASGMYTLELEPGVSHLKISSDSNEVSVVVLDYLRYINGLNTQLGINDDLASKISYSEHKYTKSEIEKRLLDTIRDLDDKSPNPKFYYTNRIRNSQVIEQDNLLNPLAFYDVNNIANKFTISQIDMSTISTDIDILRSSRL